MGSDMGELLGEEENCLTDDPGRASPAPGRSPRRRGYGCPHPRPRPARRVGSGACAAATPHTNLDPQLDRPALRRVASRPSPAETLGRFNVCPTEPVLAVCDGEARALRWGLDPAVGAQAARGAGADQRARRDAARQAPVRPADRRRRRTAASCPPTAGTSGCGPSTRRARASPFRYTRRRRRAVRVRRAVARGPRGRRADRVDDDPHHDRERASARRCTTACRVVLAVAGGRGRLALARRRRRRPRSSCSRRSRRRAPRRRPRTPP